MSKRRMMAWTAAALVLGLVAGGVVTGVAAPAPASTTASTGFAGCGMRLGAAVRASGGRLADTVATLTGQDVASVTQQRQDGVSFAQIAAKKNVDVAAVVSGALATRQQVLADRVASGAITQEQADAALATMQTRLTERVNATDGTCTGAGSGTGCGGGAASGAGCGIGGGGRGRCGSGACGTGVPSTTTAP